MALSTIYTRANVGIQAPQVTVEVHLSNGIPSFQLVGLPETTVKESRDRVRSAIINSGFEFPSKRITVNLAPADLPKGGGRFDLAIAVGILTASEQIPVNNLDEFEFVGELALSGELRSIQGALPMAVAAMKIHRSLILPVENAEQAALVKEASVLCADSLWSVYLHLSAKQKLPLAEVPELLQQRPLLPDIADVKEQQVAKRALILAAAGGHNLLLYGPPGTGKSMLASRLIGLLPDLDDKDALTVASINSVVGNEVSVSNWRRRPFRQPHHSSSATAIVGGGSYPVPGEITLAHKGVLFLDELPEFGRHVLDVLREPLETGQIHLSRAKHKVSYPADFQLVAAMNPSPTGDINDGRCNADQTLRYLNRLSGPLLDRIDLQVHVPRIDILKSVINKQELPSITTEKAKIVINHAVEMQMQRQSKLNAQLGPKEVEIHCQLDSQCTQFIQLAMDKLRLSMRSYHRILKVARTIADIANKPNIEQAHLAEAISYRSFDRMLDQLTNS
ncbi:YifB family Mg chelatase-like AAA ATPase [Glaciecola sp. 1036]|uniref:YifB family Mg chelatase-like AAA ATPase n=1 Tax=Alteromonadaceae TaxID=72275 RepID=UPI003D086B22